MTFIYTKKYMCFIFRKTDRLEILTLKDFYDQ